MIEKLHIYIAILAALITTIYCIIVKNNLNTTATCLVITIIIFYIIGVAVKNYILKNIKSDEDNEIENNTENIDDEYNEQEHDSMLDEAVSEEEK